MRGNSHTIQVQIFLVVRAIVLALRIKESLPIVRLVAPLRIGVHEDLYIISEEGRAAFEYCQCLRPAHEPTNRSTEDGWGRAPRLGIAREDIEGRAVLRVDDQVALNIATDAQRGADWWALVGHSKELA